MAVSVGPDDQTLTVEVPTACGDVANAQPVKVAQNKRDVVIGFYGPKLTGGICLSSARVSFHLAWPLGTRTVYDARTGKARAVVKAL